MLKHILVAVDGSEHAHKALEQALILAEDMKQPASLLIVHVNPTISINEPALGVDLEARIAEEGQHIIEPVTRQLSGRDVAYETLLIAGDPVNEICRVARERDCRMIVMGTGGKGMLAEMIVGSVSHGVLKHADCPVLTVK
ncbi:Nucleotide-binding universal stress protein, UspA family [Paenibacillus sp. CF095]|uniref:universal stress protein n=1 Tax=unclassified Paenibacillus TaxID=185978 RepID=UPI00088A26BF|nr:MULTISPECIES: universal stress protein [unclassified Paenibacillus]WJM08956.1 universal stress protein [Paenibacillus sp. PK1-4R]SDD93220.1 Nucleotide-binding universal stress protein, UspA family [Paenibacillus sp. CF095]